MFRFGETQLIAASLLDFDKADQTKRIVPFKLSLQVFGDLGHWYRHRFVLQLKLLFSAFSSRYEQF